MEGAKDSSDEHCSVEEQPMTQQEFQSQMIKDESTPTTSQGHGPNTKQLEQAMSI